MLRYARQKLCFQAILLEAGAKNEKDEVPGYRRIKSGAYVNFSIHPAEAAAQTGL